MSERLVDFLVGERAGFEWLTGLRRARCALRSEKRYGAKRRFETSPLKRRRSDMNACMPVGAALKMTTTV